MHVKPAGPVQPLVAETSAIIAAVHMPRNTMSPPAPIRVMHIASGDLWAGAEAQVATLLAALSARGDIEVQAAILNPGELASRLTRAGVPTTVLDERRLPAWRIALALRAQMARFRPTVVHTHRRKENILGAIAAASLGIPSLRTAHGADEHPVTWRKTLKWLAQEFDRLVARRVQSRVVAVSDELAVKLRHTLPGAHIEVVDNIIDAEDVLARSAGGSARPQQPPWRIGIVGRLVPVKRVDLFLAAAHELLRRAPGQYTFHVIGDGPLQDELQTQARTLGDAVTFHGFVANPAPLIASLNALLITSDHEGLPTVALEALALQVPVVTRPIGGLPALAAAGGDCRLMPQAADNAAWPAVIANAVAGATGASAAPRPFPERYLAPVGASRYRALYARVGGGANTTAT